MVTAFDIKDMELKLDIRPSGWLMSTACGPCPFILDTMTSNKNVQLMKTYVLMF